jgi:hypothetical protein
MDRFDLKIVGGNLIADTSTVIDGPARGAKRWYSPAKGPSCLPKA